jgi:outer membrane protein
MPVLNSAVRAAVVVACFTAIPASAQPAAEPSSPLTLDAALQYALEHYPTLRVATEQVNAAAANVNVARATYLPRLDAVWQTNRATANNVFGQLLPQSVIPSLSGPVLATASGSSVWGSAAGGLLSWEAIDLGLRAASVQEAQANVGRARAEEDVTRLSVQGAVGSAFLAVVAAEQSVAAADADVSRRDVLARAAHVLADNDLRPGAEASRADAEHAAARTRAAQARQALAVARATLARVLGLQAGTPAVAADRLLAAAPTPDAPAGSPADHPIVRAGEAAVAVSRARERLLEKTNRPRVLLQSALFARGTGASTDGLFSGGADGLGLERANWAAGVQVVFPNLFEVSSLRARRAAAAAGTRADDARRDEALLSVTSQQQTADAIVEASIAIAQNTPIQLAAARQSEVQARARYDAGLAGIVEVADAQNLLAAAEYQDAAARVDVWRALLAQAIARGAIAPFIARVRTSGVQ